MKKEPKTVVLPWGDAFKEKWDLWKEFKKEQFYFSYKPIGEQGALKDLVEMSEGIEEVAFKIIDNAIAKGWRGLFPIKIDQNGATGGQSTNKQAATIDGFRESLSRRYGAAG
jgi:hypothetical protein